MRTGSDTTREQSPHGGMGGTRRSLLVAAGTVASAGIVLILTSTGTSASATPKRADNVTLCHATSSVQNPYVTKTVDPAGAFDGHLGHTGPVFSGDKGSDWGDIIPPFVYNGQTYSLNWPAGQAIFDKGCTPGVPSGSSSPPSTEPPSTEPPSTEPPSTEPPSTEPPSTDSSSADGTSTARTSVPPSSASAGVSGVSSTRAAATSSAVSSAGVSGVSAGPLPNAVDAGLHAPLTDSGTRAWGILMVIAGGVVGLGVGVWPNRRRAH